MDAAMEKKLRELIDRQEIWQVLLRYAQGLDRLDVPMTRSCYWDDAIEDHEAFIGTPDEFIAWANNTSMMFDIQHHGLMNHKCDLDGDNAYADTHFLYLGRMVKPPHFMSMGRYIDHFQRRNGEWRIANRVALVECNFDLSDSRIPMVYPEGYGPQDRQISSRDRRDTSYHRPPRPRKPRTAKAAE